MAIENRAKRIIHISPTVPPSVNGLGDFCYLLAEELFDNEQNIFFIYEKSSTENAQKNTVRFTNRNFYNSLLALKPEVIILHYVGYAYDSKGLPFYIARGLKKILLETGSKLLVFFHELFSSSNNPLKLPFYTNFFQKQIVQNLYNLSFCSFTNCTIYNEILQKTSPSKTRANICTGIFSNVPDSLYNSSTKKDRHTIVVFGTQKNRQFVYNSRFFISTLEKLRITTIIDIGPGKIAFTSSSAVFVQKGTLSTNKIAYYLNKSSFGALNYPSFLLGKSGIFSAYAAFGIIPINFEVDKQDLFDDLIEGKNYFNYNSTISLDNLDLLRLEVRKWYEKRSLEVIAKIIGGYI